MDEGEIAMSLGMSTGLVKEYMEIIKKYQEDRKVNRDMWKYVIPEGFGHAMCQMALFVNSFLLLYWSNHRNYSDILTFIEYNIFTDPTCLL